MLKFSKLFYSICESINDFHTDQITNTEMGEIIASHQIKNENNRMNDDFVNLKKLLFDDEMTWFLLKDNNQQIVACAAIRKQQNDIWFINELFSFRKGCGSILLLDILNNYDTNMVYLNSDWSQPQSLNEYYKQQKFGLTEYIYHRDHYDIHYFYKNNNLSEQQLNQFIEQQFI